ncbi:MAG TPA: hypothetical protein VGT03_04015 [Candidatus Acidoferrales bacterium]|nr:hypothetical protein [Candidatus Acidoferrales bacterium]
MTNQTGNRRSRSPYVEWIKTALITGLVMGTLWILLFTEPLAFGNSEAVVEVFYFVLLLPGAIIAFPAILANVHGFWPGWLVIGAILNWLLYSQLVYLFVRFRRRKREAGLPPPEPEVFDYRSRWQKPAR